MRRACMCRACKCAVNCSQGVYQFLFILSESASVGSCPAQGAPGSRQQGGDLLAQGKVSGL